MRRTIEVGTVVNERYQILQAIGSGSTAVVYLVWDQRLKKQWALKAVDPPMATQNQLDSFNEAHTLLALEHERLPKVIDVFQWGDFDMIVRDFIPGDTMEVYIDKHGPFDLKRFKNPLMQLAEVLNYLHSLPMPMIYRDLKPANIIIKPTGELVIVDFGIARRYNPLHQADTVPLGTKGYCPPEQYAKFQTEPRSDIYGLGAIIYYALVGEHIFSLSEDERWDAFQHDNMSVVRQVIEKCMSYNIHERYQTTLEVVNALYPNEGPQVLDRDEAASAPRLLIPARAPTGIRKTLVGLIGAHRGIGTTYIAWGLSQSLSCKRYNVALVMQNDHNSFALWRRIAEGEVFEDLTPLEQHREGQANRQVDRAVREAALESFKYKKVTIYNYQSASGLIRLMDSHHDFIVMDYGTDLIQTEDFLRCHSKWVVCPKSPWTITNRNSILSRVRDFSAVGYLVNLATEKEAQTWSQWMGLTKKYVKPFPYNSGEQDYCEILDLNVGSPLSRQSRKQSIFQFFKGD